MKEIDNGIRLSSGLAIQLCDDAHDLRSSVHGLTALLMNIGEQELECLLEPKNLVHGLRILARSASDRLEAYLGMLEPALDDQIEERRRRMKKEGADHDVPL